MGPDPGPGRHCSVARVAAVLVLGLLAVSDIATSYSIPTGMGPFRVEFRGVTPCAASECHHPEKMDIRNLKVNTDPNHQWRYIYNVDINMSVPLDDGFKTDLKVSRWNSLTSSWTNNVFKMTVTNACSMFKTHRPDLFKQVSDLYYGGSVSNCPLPPVAAQVRDFVMEAKPPSNIKSLPYGRFKCRMKLIDPGQECLNCYDVVTDILPKRRT